MNAANGLDRKPVNLQSNPAPSLAKPGSAWLTEAWEEGSEGLRKQCSELSPVISITVHGDGSMCVCVCPCFTSHIHHRALSPGLGKRTGESLEGLSCRLQRCTLTKHLFHKINASRLAWVPENPGRLAFAATHLIPITRQTGSEPAETIWTQTGVVCFRLQ